jgi:sugar lactone lactonase YvrE
METLLSGGAFFESPRWHDGRWWFSDFFRRHVLAVDRGGGVEEIVRVEAMPSGLGWLPDGSLLVVSDLSRLCDWHANDVVVATDGRAFVGSFGSTSADANRRARRRSCAWSPTGGPRVARTSCSSPTAAF